ncbi:GMC family oxidoreductase [Mycobacterium aquaticum]|uniref:Alanine-phosphoribitol ligase n=1 Tax=Mycobacterium aquaticum TaxID=1927124 RepID=A0A1X0B9Z3_9MYCO|nr:GMC family oxidoreductase N-terminal domain-containing protein [Mycobacterium aquaticum]ORA39162.1 alanine-phosphoribitol ligase [Mycobacterium aquaticum]
MHNNTSYDYVVIGGGTAGCVLAGRLTEDPAIRVLLIEAGRSDRHPFIHVPAGFAKLTAGPYQWGFTSAPQKACGDRVILLPQGKVLGGGGSINAQVFTRGIAADYDTWDRDYGAKGWSFDDIQKYFLLSENNNRLSAPYHGTTGPMGVSDIAEPHPLSEAFVKAGQEYGLPYNADFNGETQYGSGFYQTTTQHHRRCSTATGYIRPARKRPNLTVLTQHLVTRILLEGKRAVGVETLHDGTTAQFRATREVLLSGGAFSSPKILQLSGIGDPADLTPLGIEVRHPLVGVGKNLHDHCDLDIIYELRQYQSMDRLNLVRPATAVAGLEYLAFRSGPLASTVVEAGAFTRSTPEIDDPDLQFHFLPAAGVEAGIAAVRPGYGVTLNSYFLRPLSRGTVRVGSTDPTVQPIIDPNFLDDDYDVEISAAGVRQSREIMAQPSMSKHIKKEHLAGQSDLRTTDDYIRFVKAYGRTSYHPVGSCAMGDTDQSVVDSDLRVHGMEGLRVIDSSIMPAIVSSNTQAPTVMIAEKAVDLIRGRERIA